MPKFAQNTKGTNAPVMTVNESGHQAYAMPAKERLVTSVLTSFVDKDKFYKNTTPQILADCREILKKDPKFVARLALYARHIFNMRSVSHLLVAELSNAVRGTQWVKFVLRDVVVRPDDMTEIVAYYMNTYGRKLPKAMQAGIALAFTKFNGFSLSKYNKNDQKPSLSDVLRMCHPTAIGEQQNLAFNQLRHDTLPTAERWETKLSAGGGKNKDQSWMELIKGNKVNLMAMLKNLRNILEAKVDAETIDKMCAKLTNPVDIEKSRVLPFRFLTAWDNLPPNVSTSKIRDALESGILLSIANMEPIPGKTFISIDRSGSMGMEPITENSTVKCQQVANILGMLCFHLCEEAVITTFDHALEVLNISKHSGVIAEASKITSRGSTGMNLPYEHAMKMDTVFDRFIILSDNEHNRGPGLVQKWADAYRKAKNPKCWVHAIDMQGYGTQQFHGTKTNIMAGYSERVIDIVMAAEFGKEKGNQQMEEINSIDLDNFTAWLRKYKDENGEGND